jgi:Flp pilus assembly pilin Flp
MHTHKGQSTVEYILLVTCVTLVVILFTTGNGPGTFKSGLNQVFNQATQDMINTSTYLTTNALGP